MVGPIWLVGAGWINRTESGKWLAQAKVMLRRMPHKKYREITALE